MVKAYVERGRCLPMTEVGEDSLRCLRVPRAVRLAQVHRAGAITRREPCALRATEERPARGVERRDGCLAAGDGCWRAEGGGWVKIVLTHPDIAPSQMRDRPAGGSEGDPAVVWRLRRCVENIQWSCFTPPSQLENLCFAVHVGRAQDRSP